MARDVQSVIGDASIADSYRHRQILLIRTVMVIIAIHLLLIAGAMLHSRSPHVAPSPATETLSNGMPLP